jgi:hypothetical protein
MLIMENTLTGSMSSFHQNITILDENIFHQNW